MRAKMSYSIARLDRAKSHDRMFAGMAVDEARAILAETEPTGAIGETYCGPCIYPAERSALAETLTAFVALDLDS